MKIEIQGITHIILTPENDAERAIMKHMNRQFLSVDYQHSMSGRDEEEYVNLFAYEREIVPDIIREQDERRK